MRWFITINGSECVSPAPIEAVIYTTNARTINVHRGSTIAGECLLDANYMYIVSSNRPIF